MDLYLDTRVVSLSANSRFLPFAPLRVGMTKSHQGGPLPEEGVTFVIAPGRSRIAAVWAGS
jgi:hypothetical protein